MSSSPGTSAPLPEAARPGPPEPRPCDHGDCRTLADTPLDTPLDTFLDQLIAGLGPRSDPREARGSAAPQPPLHLTAKQLAAIGSGASLPAAPECVVDYTDAVVFVHPYQRMPPT